MSFSTWLRGGGCALQLTSEAAHVMLPQAGGRAPWHASVPMPPGAITPRLEGRNLEAEPVREALGRLAEMLPRRARDVTLVLPDACAKVTVIPIEAGAVLNRHTRAEIVRWSLRDALPFALDEAHVDDELFETSADSRCLLVAAAHRDVLREYEDAAAAFGSVVRTLPATLALGWEVADRESRQLLVYADVDAVGCVLAVDGVPDFVRTRPRRRASGSVTAAVVETLDFAADRLGAATGKACVAGLAAGDEELEATLAARGWDVATVAIDADEGRDAAGLAALRGALRAAEAGS